jgi:hypothetical protein
MNYLPSPDLDKSVAFFPLKAAYKVYCDLNVRFEK